MRLAGIRELVLMQSGRMDLKDRMIEDQDALSYYINQGSRYLDLQQEQRDEVVILVQELSGIQTNTLSEGGETMEWPDGQDMEWPGVVLMTWQDAVVRSVVVAGATSVLELPNVRSVEEVRLLIDGAERELPKMTHDELTTRYPRLGRTEASTPVAWANQPRNQGLSGVFRITLLPPAARTQQVIVYARMFSPSLDTDDDENFWSTDYPQLLSLAAQWVIESANRNREGMADYEAAMRPWLTGIEFDDVQVDEQKPLTIRG